MADQEEYLSDAMDTPAETVETTEEAPEPTAEETPETGIEQTEQTTVETPKEPEVKKDPLDSVFSNKKGEFDIDKFLDFSLPSESFQEEQRAEPEQPAAASPEDNVPEWKRHMEEERTYKNTLREHKLSPLQKVAEMIDSGVDAGEALRTVYSEQEKMLNDHFEEYDYERRLTREEQHRKDMSESTRYEEMTERAKTNISSIVAALPGKDNQEKMGLFQHIMFSPEIGAPILNREFSKQNPGYEKLPPAEQKKLADKFLVSVQSDKRELNYLWERMTDRITRLKQTEVSKRQRMLGAQQEQQRRQVAQKHPAGPIKRQQTTGSDPWGNYFGGADRV